MLKHLILKNFKSFRELDLHLGAFNVFVGANAAGKSNVLQAFKFIHDISIHGVQNAVAIQGGFKFLRNVHCQAVDTVLIEALIDSTEKFFLPLIGENKKSDFQGFTHCKAEEVRHRLVLAADGSGFRIVEDLFVCNFSVMEGTFKGTTGSITATHVGGTVRKNIKIDSKSIHLEKSMARFMVQELKLGDEMSLAFHPQPFTLLSIPSPTQSSKDLIIAYYDFDPRLSKQAVRISGSSDLDESADNLSVVIQNILSNAKQRERLFERIRDLLPHVHNLDLEHFSDSSLLMSMRERYQNDYVFPASLISNGTVSIIATLVAVLFQTSTIVIMEEPERNIHPYLIERLLNTIKEASAEKQILISTHSPTVLDNCGLDNLFLVRRDPDGVSRVTQPKDSEIVATFLAEDFGVGRLYETKLLEM